MDGDKKCHCPNCARETLHAIIPYFGLRCLCCYQQNKVEEARIFQQKLFNFVVQK